MHEERIEIRVTKSTKALLAAAAEARGVSLSAFMVMSSTREAHEVLANQKRVFEIADTAWDEFSLSLEAGNSNPSPALTALMARTPPWA